MPGFHKQHSKRQHGRAFPASRYDDPRGRRTSALERNIVRYRAAEATLYLHYAEEVRNFMLRDVHRAAVRIPDTNPWKSTEERRLQQILSRVLFDAETGNTLKQEDGSALRLLFANDRKQGKKIDFAFAYAINIGMFTSDEADELKALLEYRNEIAHRMHLVMSDLNRSYLAADHIAFTAPTYKGGALDRLRIYRQSLWERAKDQIPLTVSMDGLLFELAEHVLEYDLRRLDRQIKRQIEQERRRTQKINEQLSLEGTELVGDLAPRFPPNHRPDRSHGDDYIPATGHLSERGAEICYRLFDLGKSPIAVAYLMGMTLRSAERRQQSWLKAGGLQRSRKPVERYELSTGGCRRNPGDGLSDSELPTDNVATGSCGAE